MQFEELNVGLVEVGIDVGRQKSQATLNKSSHKLKTNAHITGGMEF